MKAYPQHYRQAVRDDNGGMDLRDYFAAMAMNGMLSFGETRSRNGKYISVVAYEIADAMIIKRKDYE